MGLLFRFLLVFVLCFTLYNPAQSTHIVGGELIYKCLDPNTNYYQFTVKLYRECMGFHWGCASPQPIADFDSVIYVTIYDMSENQVKNFNMFLPPTDTLENNTYNVCLFAPPDICIEEGVFTAKAFLPFSPGGFSFTYQRCCRTWDIENIVLPPCPDQPDVGAGWYINIPDTATAGCNSSPYFNTLPPTIICLDAEFVYDHSATDPDGDSLVYELCDADEFNFSSWGAAPNPALPPSYLYTVPYITNPPYSGSYPIYAPVDSFKIDSQTGLLTGTPEKEGVYVFAVCVSEYRNGVLLSTNKRDFQFYVAPCIEDAYPDFIAEPDHCDPRIVNFTYTGFKPETYFWDFGIDTIDTDTSSEENPTYVFPALDTTYTITLIVNMEFECADTVMIDLPLPPALEARIQYDKVCVFDTVGFFDNSFSDSLSGQIVAWEWDFKDGETDNIQDPQHIYSDTLNCQVRLIVTTDEGCKDTAMRSVTFYPLPVIIANAGIEDIYITLGESVQLFAVGAAGYEWYPADVLDNDTIPYPVATPLETTDFIVTGTSSDGCRNKDSVTVHVVDPLVAVPNAFTPNNDGENDVLYLLTVGFNKLIEFKIFNRWGQVVFETQDLTGGWDGTFKGEPQEIGKYVYYYIVEETLSGKTQDGNGEVILLR
ncbi:MAG: PKD domain-containing protein [Bacteroidota bacterium]